MVEPLFLGKFKSLTSTYLDEPWSPQEGLDSQELSSLFSASPAAHSSGLELDQALPLALREFYESLGKCQELMELHHFFWDPDELEIDQEGFLLFMEDKSETHTWALRLKDAQLPDPLVYHRASPSGPWVCEEGTFSEFMLDYFQWAFEEESS